MGEACRTKGTGDEAGEKKNNFGRVACLWATLPVFGIGAEQDRRKGGAHMKRADVNWGEVRRKYESGMYTYQRLAREYHVCTQTVWRHAIKGQWQIGREEAEKQILRRCLMATAKLLETAAAGATGTAGKRRGQPEGGQGAGRYPAGAGGDSGKDVPERKEQRHGGQRDTGDHVGGGRGVERMISMPDLFIFAQAFPEFLWVSSISPPAVLW